MDRFTKPPTAAEIEANKAARAARERILLVGCGKTKASTANGMLAARDLYTGNLFRARRAYAEATGLRWFVISAEWGLVHPDTFLETYDRTIKQLTPMQKRGWAMEIANDLAQWVGKPLVELVLELHAGRDYYTALRSPWRPGEGPDIETPLEGLGIGEQLAWYLNQNPPPTPTVWIGAADCKPRPSVARGGSFSERDLGGVLGADGNVYSDADPGL